MIGLFWIITQAFAETRLVYVDGRPLTVELVQARPQPPGMIVVPTGHIVGTETIALGTVGAQNTSVYAPLPSSVSVVLPPTPPPVVSSGAVDTAALDIQAIELLMRGMPPDPPAECRTPSDALKTAGRQQVDLGDEARMKRDNLGGVKAYLAALAMDKCNGYAWMGLGTIAVELKRPDLAIRALEPATHLMPVHYGAWTQLGQQYEAMHQNQLAQAAYWKALELSPSLAEARAGLARVGGAPANPPPPTATAPPPTDPNNLTFEDW